METFHEQKGIRAKTCILHDYLICFFFNIWQIFLLSMKIWIYMSSLCRTDKSQLITCSVTPSGRFFSSSSLPVWNNRFFCSILAALTFTAALLGTSSSRCPTTLLMTWLAQSSRPTLIVAVGRGAEEDSWPRLPVYLAMPPSRAPAAILIRTERFSQRVGYTLHTARQQFRSLLPLSLLLQYLPTRPLLLPSRLTV